ncbi:MAG: N-acetylornithine carbamoyltransferase [Saprospiraceae bacterium]|nr:N-acetylornithine carbamoyltransferase [Saprospiraceae bacterium]
MKNFLKANDIAPVNKLVAKGLQHKKDPFVSQHLGKNKTIGLLFFNSSLRTRLSSIRAAENLGAKVWVLDAGKDGWNLEFEHGTVMDGTTAEHLKEAIQVMSSYCDVMGVRAFPKLIDREEDYSEKLFKDILHYSKVPVVSLESATRHPLQSLADLITMKEVFPERQKLKVVLSWAPHPRALPQSVPNSFAEWCNAADWIDLSIAAPIGYELAEEFSTPATTTSDQVAAFENADIIYTKNWSSYSDYGARPHVAGDWIISAEKMALTNNGKFMHCLPVRRNVVVADAVIDSKNSLVIQQAENRIYSAQAVFAELL